MKTLTKIIAMSALAGMMLGRPTPPRLEDDVEIIVDTLLVGSWPLENDALDATRKRNHGIVNNVNFNNGAVLDGNGYIEIPSHPYYSKEGQPGLTISFFLNLNAENFRRTENDYVHFLGKGESGKHEWVFRIYNKNSDRPNRISFYVFNPEGGLGTGSYFEEPIKPGEWMFITGVIDEKNIAIYKNGVLKDQDDYTTGDMIVNPRKGNAPIRIGTRDFRSYIDSAKLSHLNILYLPFTPEEVKRLYQEELAFFPKETNERHQMLDTRPQNQEYDFPRENPHSRRPYQH